MVRTERHPRLARRIVFALAALGMFASAARSQCLDWDPKFKGLPSATNGTLLASCVYDDGGGPALYVAGEFTAAGGAQINGIAKWNGTSYSPLGSGIDNGDVFAFAVFNDGSGEALYAAGSFVTAGGVNAHRVAKWNGSSWSALSLGPDDWVNTLAVFDDGTGPALYAGGDFTTVDMDYLHSVPYVAKWDGAHWSAVGASGAQLSYNVNTLFAYDDGSGPALYAGGDFLYVSQVLFDHIAKWNGSTWTGVGAGMNHNVFSLAAYDDGAGVALYAGGLFTTADNVAAPYIAKWNGSVWSALGSPTSGPNGAVITLKTFDDGSGPSLYLGGGFTQAGGAPANRVAKWNGSTFSPLGQGIGGTSDPLDFYPTSFSVFDDGGGPALYAIGPFYSAGDTVAPGIAKWDGANWSVPGANQPGTQGLDNGVRALLSLDEGGGQHALYVGGGFLSSGTTITPNHVAKWDGTSWNGLADATNVLQTSEAHALTAYDDGGGTMIYAGGTAGLAFWDGSTWHFAAGGQPNKPIDVLAVFDDGTGPALYAGGEFDTAGGLPVHGIARWKHGVWSALGSGMNGGVIALLAFDDGSGNALYVGGAFTSAGGTPANYIARWNGSSWSTLGSGLNLHVYSLLPFDDGQGPKLYVGGAFSSAGGVPANGVARWYSGAWTAVGAAGLTGGLVFSLASHDDGGGPALYAGGGFASSGALSTNGIAKFSGGLWAPLGSGFSEVSGQMLVRALSSFDAGSGHPPALFVGGTFSNAGPNASSNIAAWRGCAAPVDTFCFGDGSVAPCPCGNTGVTKHGCDNSASTGGARLTASGTPSPDTIVLQSQGELPNALSIFLQGDQIVPGSISFGDGLRCAGGHLKRLFVKHAAGGAAAAPQAGDPSITMQSAALGDPIAPGSTRYYQTYYRDSNLAFCPAPQGDSWNVTNGVRVVW
jgi:hypothetical protein